MTAPSIRKSRLSLFSSIFVNPIFNDINNTNGFLVLIGSILFSVQILGDFAGYSNIAIGVAKLFNINLTKNFDEPYKAKSIKEFWKDGTYHYLTGLKIIYIYHSVALTFQNLDGQSTCL